MSSFHILVAISRYALECCDTAVHVDRVVHPHEGDLATHELDSYNIFRDDHDDRHPVITVDNAPYAFIDLDGAWRSSFLPDKIAADGEEGDYIPLDEWAAEVNEWVQELPDGLRVVRCKCHG